MIGQMYRRLLASRYKTHSTRWPSADFLVSCTSSTKCPHGRDSIDKSVPVDHDDCLYEDAVTDPRFL
jgi:hypothetical protein